jgi:DNA (cytosine-5)-methyltransferase 1
MRHHRIWTWREEPEHPGPKTNLGDCLTPEHVVPSKFIIPDDQVQTWRRLKGAKREARVHRASGGAYYYSEGAIAFPDDPDAPARTILTNEGGRTPSRSKHVVETSPGRFRRLTPEELECLNGFPPGWTEGMPDGRRAFVMGNALVVGVVERIARVLLRDLEDQRSKLRMPLRESVRESA